MTDILIHLACSVCCGFESGLTQHFTIDKRSHDHATGLVSDLVFTLHNRLASGQHSPLPQDLAMSIFLRPQQEDSNTASAAARFRQPPQIPRGLSALLLPAQGRQRAAPCIS